jgi:hypothetical protein
MFLRKVDDSGIFIEDVILDAIPYEFEISIEFIKDEHGNIIKEIEKEVVKTIPFYDDDGNILYYEPVFDVSHYVEVSCPEGFYLPKWDGIRWIEGATQEYIDYINGIRIYPTTDEKLEELALNVNDALLAIMMLSIE